MNAPIVKVAVLIGLPETVLARIQTKFKGSIEIRSIPLTRDGAFRLGVPPPNAKDLLEKYIDTATSYEHAVAIVLPYHQRVDMVEECLDVFAELGGSVCRFPSKERPWPKGKRPMDNQFQLELIECVCVCVDNAFPEPPADDDEETIKFELLRGLVSHDKMGENNHSHEDDLWKNRANGLGPRGRDRIVKSLMADGLLDRKKNKSQGGTGLVYWVANVQKACDRFPELRKYLS
jgi:hypothetical protein